MYLCHKCAGILSAREYENTAGLSGCGCISGWLRGFEKDMTRSQAIDAQLLRAREAARLYADQGRPNYSHINEKISRLEALAASEPS